MERLVRHFTGVAAKRLSAVETDPAVSHQHELNGVKGLLALFGEVTLEAPRKVLDAQFLYLADDEEKALQASGSVTWYDARIRHETRTEYRLYVPHNDVYAEAQVGDLLVVGLRPDGTVLVVVAEGGSSTEGQIRALFDLEGPLAAFAAQAVDPAREIGFAERQILDVLGVETGGDEGWLDRILARFPGDAFPATGPFSAFARETLPEVSALDDPDAALVAWMDREEVLFRTLERHHVQKQIDAGFRDVDHFVAVSLSVQNRRKSRAGRAFEAHVQTVLKAHGLAFETGAKTEDNQKPDVLFPSASAYGNPAWPADCLTMLGVKTTCKDRWRQVLAEARRIEAKHLLTLERPISVPQTDQMQANRLQLVVPAPYRAAYTGAQQAWVWDVRRLLGHVQAQQTRCGVG